MEKIEKIQEKGELLAIVIRPNLEDPLNFVTPEDSPIQLGFHNRKKGEFVLPHLHKLIPELKNIPSYEMFHITKGKAQVEIFNKSNQKASQTILSSGDTIFLIAGHSVKFLEDTKMLEVKQGPYRGKEEDKEYF